METPIKTTIITTMRFTNLIFVNKRRAWFCRGLSWKSSLSIRIFFYNDHDPGHQPGGYPYQNRLTQCKRPSHTAD